MLLVRILMIVTALAISLQSASANENFNYFQSTADKAAENDKHMKAIDYYHKSYEYAESKKEKIKALGGLIISYEKTGNTKASLDSLKLLLDISPKNKWAINKLKEIEPAKYLKINLKTYYSKLPIKIKKKIQNSLIWSSDYNALVDGLFGKRTYLSIKKWQLKNNYDVNGALTTVQRHKLFSQSTLVMDTVGWKKYHSSNNFYDIKYPAIFEVKESPNTYGGIDLKPKKSGYTLSTMVLDNSGEIEEIYDRLQHYCKEAGWKNIYRVQKSNWFVITGEIKGGGLAYAKFENNSGLTVGYMLVIPSLKNTEYESISRSIITATSNSFNINWRYASNYLQSMKAKDIKVVSRSNNNEPPLDNNRKIPAKLNRPLPEPILGSKSKGQLSAQKIFSKVNTAVWVLISANNKGVSQGSAVAIHKNYLLTNCHVLQGKENLIVNTNVSSEPLKVSLYASDEKLDRCVLYSERDLPNYVSIRAYLDLRVGEKVFTIGTPQSLSLTIAEGLLSSKRMIKNIRYLQTSAPISQGSSGGGLFDSYGNLLGITTMMLTNGQNLNFAIPVDDYWNNQ